MQNQTRQQRRAEQRANTKNSPWRNILSASQAAAAIKSGAAGRRRGRGTPGSARPRRAFAGAAAVASLAAGLIVG